MCTKDIYSTLEDVGFVAGLANLVGGMDKLRTVKFEKEDCYIEFAYQDNKYLMRLYQPDPSSYKYLIYRERKNPLPFVDVEEDVWYNKYQFFLEGCFDLNLDPDTTTHIDAINDIANGINKANNYRRLLVDTISEVLFMGDIPLSITDKDHVDGTIEFNVPHKYGYALFKLIINKNTSSDLNEAKCEIFYKRNVEWEYNDMFSLWEVRLIHYKHSAKLINASKNELVSIIQSVLPGYKKNRFSTTMEYHIENDELTVSGELKDKMEIHAKETGCDQYENPLMTYYKDVIFNGLNLKDNGVLDLVEAIKVKIKFSKFGNKCKFIFKTKDMNNLKVILNIFPHAKYNLVDIFIERKYEFENEDKVLDELVDYTSISLPSMKDDRVIDWDKFKENRNAYHKLQRIGTVIRKGLIYDD